VVKYLVANEVPRVRFPDGAYLAPVAQLVAPRSYVPMVQGSSPCRSILVIVYPAVNPALGGLVRIQGLSLNVLYPHHTFIPW
jgi:hypothetical protein